LQVVDDNERPTSFTALDSHSCRRRDDDYAIFHCVSLSTMTVKCCQRSRAFNVINDLQRSHSVDWINGEAKYLWTRQNTVFFWGGGGRLREKYLHLMGTETFL